MKRNLILLPLIMAIQSVPRAHGENDGSSVLTLDVRVQRAAETENYRLLYNSVPLRDGDKVTFHLKLNKPGYVYLYWYDSKGRASRQWPEDPASQQLVSDFIFPPPASDGSGLDEWIAIGNDRGREMVLAGYSPKAIDAAELAALEKRDIEFVEPHDDTLAAMVERNRALIARVKTTSGTLVERVFLPIPMSPPGEIVEFRARNHTLGVTSDGVTRALKNHVKTISGNEIKNSLGWRKQLDDTFADYVGYIFHHQ